MAHYQNNVMFCFIMINIILFIKFVFVDWKKKNITFQNIYKQL